MGTLIKGILILAGLMFFVPFHGAWAVEGESELQAVRSFLENFSKDRNHPADWLSLRRAIDRLGDLRIGECEDSMARILELTGDLRLKEDSPLPGVMSPMDMLKAGALLALKKIGATGRRPEVEKIYHETSNRILKNMAAETLEAFGVRVEKEQK